MAHGDPLRAKEIFENLDGEWFFRWIAWRNEKKRGKGKKIDPAELAE
jgi:predicted transcriptional regulator